MGVTFLSINLSVLDAMIPFPFYSSCSSESGNGKDKSEYSFCFGERQDPLQHNIESSLH